MIQEDQTFDPRLLIKYLAACLRKLEARKNVGNYRRVRKQVLDKRLAIRLVGQRNYGVRVCMVHMLVGNYGVKHRFDRGVWSVWVKQHSPLGGHQILIAEGR